MVSVGASSVRVTKPKPQKDLSGWLDRKQTSDLLGVSLQTVANLERRGKLTPRQDWRTYVNGARHQVAVYDPMEVANARSGIASAIRTPGEMTARAFEMFEEGRTIIDVVIALRETHPVIEDLRLRWNESGGEARVISPVAWAHLEKIFGSFKTVAELVARIDARVAASGPTTSVPAHSIAHGPSTLSAPAHLPAHTGTADPASDK